MEERMKKLLIPLLALILSSMGARYSFAQENVTVEASSQEVSDGLDLQAVAELFQEAETLEEFEIELNNPDNGINNLDLDEDEEVDYIRIVEEADDDLHIIILQVPLAEDEYQDVATIEVERNGDEDYSMQIYGDEEIYGPEHYYAPVNVQVHLWPAVRWIYRPAYKPYRSIYKWRHYPPLWKPWRPVKVHVYRGRIVHYTKRAHFTPRKVNLIKNRNKVIYKKHTSKLFKKKKIVKSKVKVKKAKDVKKKQSLKKNKAKKKNKK